MTVKEYREKHPNCKYCRFSWDVEVMGLYYCEAKERYVVFNKANKAKKCELYQAKERV